MLYLKPLSLIYVPTFALNIMLQLGKLAEPREILSLNILEICVGVGRAMMVAVSRGQEGGLAVVRCPAALSIRFSS